MRYEFDESPTVRAAIKSVATEGAIGAALTGLMILLFLHDVRSVIVVLVSIPLSLDQLVDRPVAHGQHASTSCRWADWRWPSAFSSTRRRSPSRTPIRRCSTRTSVARAARRAAATTATARLLAMLCILSVFIPTFILNEPVRSLFMPLTLAVGFSMIASYLLSSTLVPVLSVWLVRHAGEGGPQGRVLRSRSAALRKSWRSRCGAAGSWFRPTWLLAACCFGWSAGRWARNCFPRWIPASSCCVFGAAGLRIRVDAEMRRQDPGRHRRAEPGQAWRSRWATSALGATNTATNNILLFMRASDDGVLRVRLRKDSGIAVAELRERLRKALPGRDRALAEERLGARRLLARGGRRPARGKIPSVSSRATSSAR